MVEQAAWPRMPALRAEDVHVWHARLDAYRADGHAWAVLGNDEVAHARRFHRTIDRDRYVVSHAIVRLVLARYLGCDAAALRFATGDCGKPALDLPAGAPALHFNLSHSHDMMLLAVARREVGVDVERMTSDFSYDDVAASVFSTVEQSALQRATAGDRARAFFTGWTRKEAYIKATGLGISAGLTSFDVSLEPASHAPSLLGDRRDPSALDRWSMHDLDVDDGYVASLVAAETGARRSTHSVVTWDGYFQ